MDFLCEFVQKLFEQGTYLWNVRASLRFYVTCISVIACTRVRDTDRQMTRSCSDIPPCPPS